MGMIRHSFIKQRMLYLLFCFVFCGIYIIRPLDGICKNSTEVIQVEFRKASELLPMFHGMLSGEGDVTVDIPTNSIIITDDQKRIDKIKSLIQRLDVPPQQLRIRVKFQEESLNGDRSISGEGSVSGDNWEINTGNRKRNGVRVRASDRNTRKSERAEYFINVLSGSPAYILAGKNIIYRERWGYLLEKYAHYNEQIIIQRIETGFDVKPVVTGGYANIEIIPRISHENSKGRKKIVRFAEAATTISVPLNQWVTIGNINKNSNEVISEILKSGTSNNRSSILISLMVEKD